MDTERKLALKRLFPPMARKVVKTLLNITIDVRDALIIGSCKQPSHSVRLLMLRFFGMKIGRNSSIHMGCRIYHPWNIVIGENTIINPFCLLDGRTGLRIGNNVGISERAIILSLEHDPQSPDFETRGGVTVLEDDSWIGMNATVLPGRKICRGAIVATGSVVTKDVQEYVIVAGVPAKPIGTRQRDLKYLLSYRKYFH